ncbi:aromatic acid exporter family protein [Nocardiopsis sp. ARC36]
MRGDFLKRAVGARGSGERAGSGTDRYTRVRVWLSRSAASGSYERHTLALVAKGALAATLAWLVAHHLMAAPSPAFAPFSAVLMVQVTVYQSVVQSLRFVGAIVLGVALQAVSALTAGPDILTFVLVALVALGVGQWRALGQYGTQVATAAFFAFATYVSASGTVERLSQLGQIVLLVLVGSAIGVAVNLLVFPPLRFRSAESALQTLVGSLRHLCADMSRGLLDGRIDESTTAWWRQRANALEPAVRQARLAVGTARESVYYNPRRVLGGRGCSEPRPQFYEQLADSLERAVRQVESLARALDRWQKDDRADPHWEFLVRCGELVQAVASALRVLEEPDGLRTRAHAERFHEAVEGVRRHESALEGVCADGGDRTPPLGDPTRPYGVFLIETQRLLDEFEYVDELLGGTRLRVSG